MIEKKNKKIGPKFLSSKVVNQIQNNIKQRVILYQKYLADNAISSVDPVINRELLIGGWNESIIHKNEIVRTVKEKFNLILNLRDAKRLIITAALIGEESYTNPIYLTVKVNDKVIGRTEVKYSFFFQYSFTIPKKLRKKNAKVQGEIRKTNRNTEMGIRLISTYARFMELDSIQEITIEIQKMKRDTDHLLQILEWHKNPEHLLPAETSSRSVKKIIKKIILFMARPMISSDSLLIKKIVLRMIRPFSTPQIIFNKHLTDILVIQSKRIEKLESLVLSRIKVSGDGKK